ncbi:hypothetical protein FA10DRAFT_133505 [Acaromyces ingoldii]|uniref:Uncharacterized protein n=1 Tax=Acaromyces ingoldii TaxID=215250 RepID=A0A316YHQ8_9BASI|nr:hypothetical protein FA10DRAFT_133505 [Acaromyces ingoldii]PWN88967.1 hypothetical protein FA10DRAFT_133505 [Acaromyces ingoldii]
MHSTIRRLPEDSILRQAANDIFLILLLDPYLIDPHPGFSCDGQPSCRSGSACAHLSLCRLGPTSGRNNFAAAQADPLTSPWEKELQPEPKSCLGVGLCSWCSPWN